MFYLLLIVDLILYFVGRKKGFNVISDLYRLVFSITAIDVVLSLAAGNSKVFILYSMSKGFWYGLGLNLLSFELSFIAPMTIIAIQIALNTACLTLKKKTETSSREISRMISVKTFLKSIDTVLMILAVYTFPSVVRNLALVLNPGFNSSLVYQVCCFLVSTSALITSILIFSTWMQTYRSRVSSMLKLNSYIMMTCAKYGIRHSLVTESHKKYQITKSSKLEEPLTERNPFLNSWRSSKRSKSSGISTIVPSMVTISPTIRTRKKSDR